MSVLTGSCYCGGVTMAFDAKDGVEFGAYCHCTDCRKAHAAPLYQCVYFSSPAQLANFKVTKGQELIKEYTKPGAPLMRAFCTECGSRVYARHEKFGTGIYPAQFDTFELPDSMKPTLHFCAKEAVIPLDKLNDGLPHVNP